MTLNAEVLPPRQKLADNGRVRGLSEPILLLMPGSHTETLLGHNDYMLNLLSRAVRGDRTPEMDLIARSQSS